MNWQDTVMGNKKIQLLGQQYEDDLPTYDLNLYILLAQSEISFKAGMKEVLECVRKNHLLYGVNDQEKQRWYEQVKEWGVE